MEVVSIWLAAVLHVDLFQLKMVKMIMGINMRTDYEDEFCATKTTLYRQVYIKMHKKKVQQKL